MFDKNDCSVYLMNERMSALNIKSYNRDEVAITLQNVNERISAVDHLLEKYDDLTHYSFQLRKNLTNEELSDPYRFINEIYEKLPRCIKDTVFTVVLLEKNEHVRLSFSITSSIRARITHHAIATTVYSAYANNQVEGGILTICFLGIPVNETNMDKLESSPLLAPCAKEQVRQKRLLSLYQ